MSFPLLRSVAQSLAVPTLLLLASASQAVETITINPAVTHQTIEAWGAAGGNFVYAKSSASLRAHLIDDVVNNLGLTQTRIEAQNGNFSDGTTWERLNDNNDSSVTNTSMLNTNVFDSNVSRWCVPMKQLVEANGEQFTSCFSASFYDNGSSGTAPAWLLNNPGEYGEWLSSVLLRLKNVHGITATYYTILNEAGYGNGWNPSTVVPKMIKTIGPKIQSLGLPSKIQYPENLSPSGAWTAINNTWTTDPEIYPYIGMLSYHLYSSPYDPSRSQIRDFGIAHNIPRAQTEFTGQTVNILYDDLTLGGVSVWDLYYWETTYLTLNDSWFSRKAQYWNVRQVTKYVRPGSVRVDATSTSASIRPLSFMLNGKATTVLWNNSGGAATTANIAGLTANASYGVCSSTGGTFQIIGVLTASAGGVLNNVTVPKNAIVTIYPHSTNLPPTMVDWRSSAQFLTLPASTTTLSASALDPELDAVSYAWSVVSKPTGASVSLATPNTGTTTATGLTVAGNYVFQVAVSDPTHTFTRTVEVSVYSSNQAPVLVGVHNRQPVTMTLPVSATVLRAGATDLEGDAITFQWSVLSQPAGAAAVLATPTTSGCNVSGMTVAGNYVFQIAASDPTHTVTTTLTVPVYPTNIAPVVSIPTASPATITLPTSSTTISAFTSDPDAAAMNPWRAGGDVLTHWWEVTSAPAGAKPIFATPGLPTTTVSNLTVAGTYTFKISAMDRTLITSKTVTVTVNAGGGTAPEIALTRNSITIVDGSTDPVTGLVAGTASVVTYQIGNIGTAALSVGTPSISALVNCTATITTTPAASVAAGGSTTLAVRVTPTAAGAWSCNVSSVTNDSNENPTNWTMSGTATAAAAPEIALSRSGTAVADGSTDTVTGLVAATASVVTYTINNTGTAALTVGAPTISALVNCTATVSTSPAASVAAAGSTTCGITVTPTAVGAWSCNVSSVTNDSNENPTNWTVSGTAIAASNTAPVISTTKPASLTTLENTANTVVLAASDADGDTLTWSVLTQGSKGTMTVSSPDTNVTATYTPTTNLNGSDTVVIQVADGRGGTDTITVNVTITAALSGPRAHWKLDETSGTTAADASGNAHTGTLVNGPTWGIGTVGGALNLDGTNDYVRVANASDLAVGQAVSIAAWFKRGDTTPRNMRLVNKPTGGKFYSPTYSLQFDVGGNIGGNFYSTSGKWIGIGGVALSDTNWHHVVMIIDVGNHTG
ncbi:MAG: Ig-like domain-containing protein, partial [Planctomycetota bacterium]